MGKKSKHKGIPGDAELLAELATLDDVSARIPTATEHDQGVVPPWCELVLAVRRDAHPNSAIALRDAINNKWCLRRHDGELIIEVLGQVLRPQTEREDRGIHRIWDVLDAAVDRIQARVDKGKKPRPADVSEARALTYALAQVSAVYRGDLDAVKAEVMARYDARNGVA